VERGFHVNGLKVDMDHDFLFLYTEHKRGGLDQTGNFNGYEEILWRLFPQNPHLNREEQRQWKNVGISTNFAFTWDAASGGEEIAEYFGGKPNALRN
jgi:hypothetical protein